MTYEKLGSVREHRKRIWKHIAFLGRYGHQPADVLLGFPTAELSEFSDEVAQLIKEESDTLKGIDG